MNQCFGESELELEKLDSFAELKLEKFQLENSNLNSDLSEAYQVR